MSVSPPTEESGVSAVPGPEVDRLGAVMVSMSVCLPTERPGLSSAPVLNRLGAASLVSLPLEDLKWRLAKHPFRDAEQERTAVLQLLEQADERQRRDDEARELKKAEYRKLGGSPLERLPVELLSAIVNRVLDAASFRYKATAQQKRRDALPLLKHLSLVCKPLLHLVRPRLFEYVKFPIKDAPVDPHFLDAVPSFASSIKRITCGPHGAPLIQQAPNLHSLFLQSTNWKVETETIRALLRALAQPRPIRVLSLCAMYDTPGIVVQRMGRPMDCSDAPGPSETLLPALFWSLPNLTFIAFRMKLEWQSWNEVINMLSILQHLKTLTFSHCSMGEASGYLPLGEKHTLDALTSLRILHCPEAESFLPGLLSRTSKLERVLLHDTEGWQCIRCASGHLARQEFQTRDGSADADDDAWVDEDTLADARGSDCAFVDLSHALYGIAPQRANNTFWKSAEEEEQLAPRAGRIQDKIKAIPLGKLKSLTLIDCDGWRNASSYFWGSGIVNLAYKAQDRCIDEDDLMVDEDLVPFVQTLTKLKSVHLPLLPDAEKEEGYDEDDYESGDIYEDRNARWEEATWNFERIVVARKNIKVILDDELEKGWRF